MKVYWVWLHTASEDEPNSLMSEIKEANNRLLKCIFGLIFVKYKGLCCSYVDRVWIKYRTKGLWVMKWTSAAAGGVTGRRRTPCCRLGKLLTRLAWDWAQTSSCQTLYKLHCFYESWTPHVRSYELKHKQTSDTITSCFVWKKLVYHIITGIKRLSKCSIIFRSPTFGCGLTKTVQTNHNSFVWKYKMTSWILPPLKVLVDQRAWTAGNNLLSAGWWHLCSGNNQGSTMHTVNVPAQRNLIHSETLSGSDLTPSLLKGSVAGDIGTKSKEQTFRDWWSDNISLNKKEQSILCCVSCTC